MTTIGRDDADQNNHQERKVSAQSHSSGGTSPDMTNNTTAKTWTKASDRAGEPLPPELQGFLGKQLRAVYGELVHEPIPDKFLKLLQDLDAKETKS